MKTPKYVVPFWDFSAQERSEPKIIDWEEADGLLPKMSVFRVTDEETGVSWNMKRTSGKHHADVEPLTPQDSDSMASCFPVDTSFEGATYRRVVVDVGAERYVAALMGFPHAGSEQTAFKQRTDSLSGGFKGIPNWDYVRGNGVTGHFCLHFRGSKRHHDGLPEPKAQELLMG